MKKLIATLALAGISICTYAQNGGKISGMIKDGGNQKVIDAASISLLKAQDSSLVKTSLTNKDGSFAFENLNDGKYLVMATSIGHSKVYSTPLEISAAATEANTGILQLVATSKDLNAVTVSAKKQFIERKIDKTVINPDAMISNAGANALEMLEKAPGITIDKDGNISLKGKQGVIIMLDGKPSYMSGTDLINYLTNLPSGNIDQVEIMTNPPAKYDAAGNSGIINIKSKKSKLRGFNGSLSTSQGHGENFRSANSLSLNYRRGKFNTFSTLNANYRENPQWLDINRQYLQADKSVESIFEQESYRMRINRWYNVRAGADYYMNNKTTLGVVLTAYTSPTNENGTNASRFYSPSKALDSSLVNRRREDAKWNHNGINFNLRHKFDSTGRELTADFDYLSYNNGNIQDIVNTKFDQSGNVKEEDRMNADLPSVIHIFSAKTDYVQTIGKDIKFEAGLKTSFVKTDNNANYFITKNGVTTPDYNTTNFFKYQENLNAGYINLSTQVKKWGFQLGVRAENTNYEGLQYGNPTRPDSAFSRSYTSAFPTMYVSYQMDKKNQFGFNYGRRINRPDYEDLNPFIHFIDPYTYEVGNPFLRPMFSNTMELSYSFKNLLNSSVSYTNTKDLFGEAFSRENGAIVVRESNFGRSQNLNLSVGLQLPVAKWWKANLNTQANYSELYGILNNNVVDVQLTSYTVSLNNQFTFNKGWSAELSGFYRSRGGEGQIIIGQMAQFNAGVQKTVLKKKGSLKLSVSDFTGPMIAKGRIADVSAAQASFRQYRDSRVATLTFNYRFGKMYKVEKRKTGGAGDEQNRVGGAN
ncbi:MAG: TonB-dependent receptor [Chitinophagaceae bacterium]|nr:MAG: TonB-dependent receptor [Chitinophagaceae bacterium]